MLHHYRKCLWFIPLLMLMLTTSVWGQDPEITENILPEIKRMGVTGRLYCTVINKMDNPVYWIHKEQQMTISSDDKIVIDDKHNVIVNGYPKYMVEVEEVGDSITFCLVVNRLEPRDAGNYTCQILVRGDTEHPAKDGEMVVLTPPAVVLSRTSNTISVKQGDSANLTCEATGYPNPNVTWVRVNAGLLPNGYLRYQNTRLEIHNTSTEDRGIYRCLADNNVRPPAVHDVTLLIFFTPVARTVQSSYGQAENRMLDVTIECTIAGWPEPELQWYQVQDGGNWMPINNDDKHTVNILLNHANVLGTHERWFQLVIRTVTANDYGDYICEGYSDMGRGHATVNLFATSECQGPNCPEETQPERQAGVIHSYSLLTLLLTCIALVCLH